VTDSLTLRDRNIAALRSSGHATLADRFATGCPTAPFKLEQARNGTPTLRFGEQTIHSRYQPQREADGLADTLLADVEPGMPVYLLGIGLGYIALAIADKRPNHRLILLEPDERVFELAISTMDLSSVFVRASVVVGSEGVFRPQDFETISPEELREASAVVLPACRTYAPHAESSLEGILRGRAAQLPQGLRIMVVGAIAGGSVPIGRYVTRALLRLGHKVDLLDLTPFAPGKSMLEKVSGNKTASQALQNQYTELLGRTVLARAEEFQPQLVFFMAQSPGTREAVEELHRAKVPTAFWFVEDGELFEYGLHVAPWYDLFFHIQKGGFEERLKKAGVRKAHYLPLAADPEIHRKIELTDADRDHFGSDISHMGAGYFNRRQFFLGLTDLDFKLWGSDWEGAGLLGDILQKNGERVDEEEIVRIYNASRINLNLHSSTYTDGVNPHGDFVNPRTFEIASCGGFQLVDERSLLPELFEVGKEVVVFSDLASCRQKIEYYLAHPDEAAQIAEAGRQRVLSEHTYEHRMREALEVIARTCELPETHPDPNTVRSLIQDAGEDQELADFFARMGAPDDVLTLEGVAEKILHDEQEMGETEALFLLMNEFRKWAQEKGVV